MAIIVQPVANGARGPRRARPDGRGTTARGSRRAPVRTVVAILSLACLGAVASPARAQEAPVAPEGTFVRITVDGGVSPFSSVQYDVTVRGRTVIVTHVKESLCYRGQQERMRLVEGDAARDLVRSLQALGAFAPPVPRDATPGRARDREAPRDAPRCEFWSAWGTAMTRFSLGESALREFPDLLRVRAAVRDAVVGRVGALPMRDLYHPAQRLGLLTITATEPATATLDGWDTFALPVESLEVVEGDHRVTVVGASGRTREFRVRVVAGGASRIHVLLDGQE